MALREREEGGVQPGIKWWRFTARIPGIHVGISWPEVIQGGLLSAATGGAVAPLMMRYFEVSFEIAWTVCFIQIFWIWISTILFSDPYPPGWITPALPLVIVFLNGFAPGLEAIQAMTALTVCISAIFLFFGITQLGGKFVSLVPVELRAGIIMGSAVAAFNAEFTRHASMPVTLTVVWAVVFLLLFSVWFGRIKAGSRTLTGIASMAMLIGFLVAAIVGPLAGELKFDISMGIYVPQFSAFLQAVSPFFVGWPSWDMYLKALPLAAMIYIIVFGDLLVADTLIKDAERVRTDEKIIIDPIRTHFALFFRNIGHLLTGGPFIPLHGPIWTGVAVFIIGRYKEGRKNLDSIYTGIINWYWLGFILVLLAPVVDFMRPMLPVALSITMILTGFACAYIAMSMLKTPTGQGYALFIGLLTAKFGPAYGLAVGVALYFLLLIQRKQVPPNTHDVKVKQ